MTNPFLAGRAPPAPVVVIGHRGCAHAAENTIEAFAKAIELGARMIEFDVRERLVISHDETRKARPTLEDALRFFRDRDVFANIELKIDGIVDDAVRLVRKHDLVERAIVSSFRHDQVARAKRLCPAVAGGVLSQDRLADPGRYVREIVGADVYGPGREVFQKAEGIGTHVWTVNDPREMRRFIAAGVTGIFTDYPERLVRVLNARPR